MLVVPALGMGADATKAFIKPFELEQSTPRRDTPKQEGETTEVRDQKLGPAREMRAMARSQMKRRGRKAKKMECSGEREEGRRWLEEMQSGAEQVSSPAISLSPSLASAPALSLYSSLALPAREYLALKEVEGRAGVSVSVSPAGRRSEQKGSEREAAEGRVSVQDGYLLRRAGCQCRTAVYSGGQGVSRMKAESEPIASDVKGIRLTMVSGQRSASAKRVRSVGKRRGIGC